VLGDDFLQLLGQAFPDSQGKENLSLVRREAGDVGIYHVWPSKQQIWFQRHRSVFGLMDPTWFDRAFWLNALAPIPGSSAPQVLHLTGITPLISVNTRAAWSSALETARSLKEDQGTGSEGRLIVTLDLNHRPALGSWPDLWRMVEPHIGTLDLLVFSIGDVIQVAGQFEAPFADAIKELKVKGPAGLAGGPALDACVREAIRSAQTLLGNGCSLAVTCKVRQPDPSNADGLPRQLRWSVVCLK
ncbi:unnamed protein product, partial [Polarella glacialis]